MKNEQIINNNFSTQLGRQMMNSFVTGYNKAEVKDTVNSELASEKKTHNENRGQPEMVKRIEKLESLLNLYSDLYKQSGEAGEIDLVMRIGGKGFFDNYYFSNKPVIISSMMQDWPAMRKWSPDFFLNNYGDASVNITMGRNKDSLYEKNFRNTVTTIQFREYINLVKDAGNTNDIYLVARNYFFSNPDFRTLRNDVIPPGEIIDTSYPGPDNMKLWFGPCGTVTPLHHDKHSILFCQVYGRKHFKMIPSFDLPKIYNTDRYYSEVDPETVDGKKHPLFLKASVAEVILDPGDMLFIPAGWWHWVRSLDVSISVTFSNFAVKDYNTAWNCE